MTDAYPELAAGEWQSRRQRHFERLQPYAEERLDRMWRGVKHPVNDFLFEYYSFRPAHLLRWSPGPDILLRDAGSESDWPREAVTVSGGTVIPAAAFPDHRLPYLGWAIDYLERTGDRAPNWNCFGLHEWAMLYRAPEARHAATPLRLSGDAIAAAVDELGLRCTHYDAYRFFTPEAAPKNRISLSRAETPQNDQPACIHAVMDLYKFAFKIAPWIDADITADAFLLAWEARQLDMRASPYDLTAYGWKRFRSRLARAGKPTCAASAPLATAGNPIRNRLLQAYLRLKALREKQV